jgi:hypothetical protein
VELWPLRLAFWDPQVFVGHDNPSIALSFIEGCFPPLCFKNTDAPRQNDWQVE